MIELSHISRVFTAGSRDVRALDDVTVTIPEGEIFGLYATTGRAVSFLAPMLFAAAIEIGRRFVEPGTDAQYWGVIGLVIVLLAGLLLLLPVRPPERNDQLGRPGRPEVSGAGRDERTGPGDEPNGSS